MTSLLLRRDAVAWLVVALLAAAAFCRVVLGSDGGRALVSEWGVVENMTVAAYAILAVALFAQRSGDLPFFRHSALLAVLLAMREMDLHKRFTTESMSKSSYWLYAEAPVGEKLIAGVILLAVLYAFVRYARHLPRLRDGLRLHKPYAWSVLGGILLVPLSKMMDAMPRWLRPWLHSTPDSDLRATFMVFEEWLELGIPLCFLLALVQLLLLRSRSPEP